jgi:hypothetical protein
MKEAHPEVGNNTLQATIDNAKRPVPNAESFPGASQ